MWGPELITPAEALSHLAVSPPLAVMRVRVTWLDRLVPWLMLVAGGLMLAAGLTKPSFDTAWPRYLAMGIFYAIGLLALLGLKRAKQPESWFMAVSNGKLLLNTQDYILPPARAEGATVLTLNLQNITALEPRQGVVLVSCLADTRKGVRKVFKPFAQLVIHLSEPLPAACLKRFEDEVARAVKHRSRGVEDGIAFIQRHALWTTDDHATLVVNLRRNTTPNLTTFLQALGSGVEIKPMQATPFGDVPFAVLGYRGPVTSYGATKVAS